MTVDGEQLNARIVFMGAGAIGGVCAGLIQNSGIDVEIITKYPELATKIATEGIHVLGPRGDHRVKIQAHATVEGLTGQYDYIFTAVKATDLPQAIEAIQPYIHEKSAVITLENGLCEDLVASVIGPARTVGAIVGWGGTLHSPGVVEMTSPGEFVIGNLDNSVDDRLKAVQQILSHVNPCYISQNIYGTLYSKLLINACITALGAVCGLFLGDMLARRHVREIFIEIIREGIVVADAMGLKVEVFSGKLDYYAFIKGDSWLAQRRRHILIRIIGFKYRKVKSSSLQSLERHKPTEIDYLNGYITAQGRKYGVLTPVNDLVVKQIKEIEAGAREITPVNFSEYPV